MPLSNAAIGRIHENHKAIIARGPWRFDGIQPARYESRPTEGGGTCEVPVCAGTCTICGQGICDVVWIASASERLMIGVDCASTFADNLGKTFRDAKSGLLKVKREATTRRKGEKLAIVLAPLRAEMNQWIADYPGTFRANVAANALRVMDKGRRLSAAHMALVTRLRSEEAPAPVVRVQRPEKVAEVNVAAPEGRTTVRGVVVSAKGDEKCFGGHRTIVYRMTVKVATEAGVYLVNGTLPQALFDACEEHLENVDGWVSVLRGCEVEFSAELTRSDKEHFAFASRPTRARLVSWPAEKAKRVEDVAA